jgi:hypothetical protein
MPKPSALGIVVVTCGAMVMGLAEPASAATNAKKLTYEQAWAKCQAQINKAVPGDQASARHSWGSACMRKYGHKI